MKIIIKQGLCPCGSCRKLVPLEVVLRPEDSAVSNIEFFAFEKIILERAARLGLQVTYETVDGSQLGGDDLVVPEFIVLPEGLQR